MNKIFKAITYTAMAAVLGSPLWAENSIQTLLEGYLKNDLSIQEMSAEVGKEILEKDKTYINNGMEFQLETGTIKFTAGENSSITFNPDATVSFPGLNNLTVKAETDVTVGISGSSSSSVEDTSISLTADIYSSAIDERKITLLKADRSVLELQRKLQDRFVTAEKEFYTELKSLYSYALDVVKSEKDLYEDQLEFEQVKAKGYSSSSSKYRTAQMEVLNDQHEVETGKHKLEREVKIFASECGVEYDAENAKDFLPSDIPEVEAIDVLSFPEDDYTEIESAKWTAYINQLTRDSEKAVTLTGNAGYTFNNETTSSDTVDAGLGFTWNATGLGVEAGVSVPVASSEKDPVYSLGLTFTPKTISLKKITAEEEKLEVQQEQLAIDSARNDYDTSVITQQTELADINWSRTTIDEALDMYSSLAEDTLNWYNQGIVTESEYLSASVNKESYAIQSIMNKLELIIYNDETTLLFHRDQELKHEKEIK